MLKLLSIVKITSASADPADCRNLWNQDPIWVYFRIKPANSLGFFCIFSRFLHENQKLLLSPLISSDLCYNEFYDGKCTHVPP